LHPVSVPLINMLPLPNNISSYLNLFQASWVWRRHVLPKRPFRVVIRHCVRVRTKKSVLMEGKRVSGLASSCIRYLRNWKFCHHHFRILPPILMILFIVAAFMTLICEFGLIVLSICLFIRFLGYYAASISVWLPTSSNLIAWPLKMGPIDCTETSVTNYYSTLCNIREERRPHLHRLR
jgi:hypothetical protein